MKSKHWKVSFNLPGSGFRANDLRATRFGGNEKFGSVELGLLMGHGSYGTSPDFNPYASGIGGPTYQTYLCSDNPSDANNPYYGPWVGLSECGFGGNLRWMGLGECYLFTDGFYPGGADNFESMYNNLVLPIPSSLHLLLGASTVFYTDDDFGKLWAERMFRRYLVVPRETVQTAWGHAEQVTCEGLTNNVTCRVVGWDNCFDDTLSDTNKGTSYNLQVWDTPIH